MPTRVQRSRFTWRLVLLAAAVLGAGCSLLGGLPPRLRDRGVPATAEILALWDTGITVNDDPVIGLRVRVMPADRPQFEATIEHTGISRLAIPRFQPGELVAVRFDPDDPTVVAVDPDPPDPARGSGNPYRDGYQPAPSRHPELPPAPAEPAIFLGTADSGADQQALWEHGYVLLGAAAVAGGDDLGLVTARAREVGAALAVVYGPFTTPDGEPLAVLPYRRRPRAANEPPSPWRDGLFTRLGADERVASFWAATAPATLGVICRPLTATETARHRHGLLVETLVHDAPAAAAGIRAGDVLRAVAGQQITDPETLSRVVLDHAGQTVPVELVRDGSSLAIPVTLAPPPG